MLRCDFIRPSSKVVIVTCCRHARGRPRSALPRIPNPNPIRSGGSAPRVGGLARRTASRRRARAEAESSARCSCAATDAGRMSAVAMRAATAGARGVRRGCDAVMTRMQPISRMMRRAKPVGEAVLPCMEAALRTASRRPPRVTERHVCTAGKLDLPMCLGPRASRLGQEAMITGWSVCGWQWRCGAREHTDAHVHGARVLITYRWLGRLLTTAQHSSACAVHA